MHSTIALPSLLLVFASYMVHTTRSLDVDVENSISKTKGVLSHSITADRSKRSDDTDPLRPIVEAQAQKLVDLTAELAALRTEMATLQWGRTQCPAGQQAIYSGYAGGTRGDETGGGVTKLCLSAQPVLDGMTASTHGNVYGAQYDINGHRHTDVPCVLCHTSLVSTFMVPGTNKCPPGATAQYHGYLTSNAYNKASQSEYVCLDAQPEDRPGTSASVNSAWFIHDVAVCGSLPCPPYVNGKVITCVVCSQ
ncbi:hypothetical protein BaRGS_00004858 [Batillaria attramentaria]|uniref:Short-chain collagen C4-like n=1 Tax=Batillaria attramentaria TaxID=370345 RepID=A0ABD0LVQ4_9CAEN